MNIFNFISRIFEFIPNNYTLIAKKTTLYFLELKSQYAHKFDINKSLLIAAAVLDAQYYLFIEPVITIEEFIDSFGGLEDDCTLAEVVCCLETFIFSIDTPAVPSADRIEAVFSQRNAIRRTIDRTLRKTAVTPKIKEEVRLFMIDDRFKPIRQLLGITDE